jgi:CheY-like chemotaxis protein
MLVRRPFRFSGLAHLGSAVDTSARGLLAIVNRILELDRLGSAHAVLDLNLSDVSITDIEKSAVDTIVLHSPHDRFRRVTFICDNQIPAHMTVHTDSTRLIQAIVYILQNAFDFTEEGCITFASKILEDGALVFDVIDTGIGIEEAYRERIFGSFEQVRRGRSGLGLSLSIAQRLAVVLGGSVTLILSTVGQGSHFQIKLPQPTLLCRKLARRKVPYQFAVDRREGELAARCPHLASAMALLERSGCLPVSSADANFIVVQPQSLKYDPRRCRERLGPDQTAVCLIADDLDEAFLTAALRDKQLSSRLLPLRAPVYLWRVELVLQQLDALRRPSTPVAPKAQKQRVMVVDDDPINLRILSMYCKKRKWDVVQCTDGRDAVEAFEQALESGDRFSLVLMDLQMVHMDGDEATRLIRRLEKERCVDPCQVFMGAFAQVEVRLLRRAQSPVKALTSSRSGHCRRARTGSSRSLCGSRRWTRRS